MLCKTAKIDPEATAPPYTHDCITAAKEPATGPKGENPIKPRTPTRIIEYIPIVSKNNYNQTNYFYNLNQQKALPSVQF